MATSLMMPQLGESVTEGTVTRWLKNVGDQVEIDEPLVEVSTDKIDTEIPSPVAGVLIEISAVEDDVVPVGALLGRIGERSELGVAGEGSAERAPARSAEPARTPRPEASGTAAARSEGTEQASRIPVTLPALGESVTEGTVTRWLKAVGDTIEVDEALVEISTDKVDTQIPSPAAGVLEEILVAEDETVTIGATLGTIAASSELARGVRAEPEGPAATDEAPVPGDTTEPARTAMPASPLVRRAAREAHVDLSTVAGTGAGGRVTRADVAATAEAPPPTPHAEARYPAKPPGPSGKPPGGATGGEGGNRQLPRLRRGIADRMVESLRVSAQVTTVVEIDLTRVSQLRDAAQPDFSAREGVRLSFLPFFMRALVDALRTHPAFNASIDADEGTVTFNDAVHLGVAVDTSRGLLVPVVHRAGDLTLAGLAHRVADLAERTRTGRVSPDDLSGGTFTISNTGSRGSLFETPIINQPQVGILGTGAVVKRPVVVSGPAGDDVIAIRSMAYFALTYDQRLIDGADAARFLTTIRERLEAAVFQAELGL